LHANSTFGKKRNVHIIEGQRGVIKLSASFLRRLTISSRDISVVVIFFNISIIEIIAIESAEIMKDTTWKRYVVKINKDNIIMCFILKSYLCFIQNPIIKKYPGVLNIKE
jgi:hypothetical protein